MHSKLGAFLECAMAYKEAGSMYEKAERPNGALPQRRAQHERPPKAGRRLLAPPLPRRPIPRLQRRVLQP